MTLANRKPDVLHRMTEQQKEEELKSFWNADNQCLFPPATIAIVLKRSIPWLQKQRTEGGGIPFLKLGHKTVVYQKKDVLDYINSKKLSFT